MTLKFDGKHANVEGKHGGMSVKGQALVIQLLEGEPLVVKG